MKVSVGKNSLFFSQRDGEGWEGIKVMYVAQLKNAKFQLFLINLTYADDMSKIICQIQDCVLILLSSRQHFASQGSCAMTFYNQGMSAVVFTSLGCIPTVREPTMSPATRLAPSSLMIIME